MAHAPSSWAIRFRVLLGLIALCLAAPAVHPAAAEDALPMPALTVVEGLDVDAAVKGALEVADALSVADMAPPALVPTEAAPAVAAPKLVDAPPAAAAPAPAAPLTPQPDAAAEPAPEPEPAATVTPAALASETPEPAEPVVLESAPVPVASQVQPVNVNVAIRIDSPGDNGSVSQENTVAVEEAPPAPSAGVEQYQPAPPQYQPGQASAETPAAPSTPAAAPTTPGAASSEPGWTWTWSCGDAVTNVLPEGVAGEILPTNWTWNWNWNCGDGEAAPGNSNAQSNGQYHPGITQYQPVNVNISIRIGSPGNDGPVSQTNVVVRLGTTPVLVTAPLPVSVPALVPSSAEPTTQTAGVTAGTELLAKALSVEVLLGADEAELTDWIFRGLTGPHVVDSSASEQASVVARTPRAPMSSRSAPRGLAGTSVPGRASAWTARAVAVTHAQASVRPDRPARARSPREPSRRPLPPMRAPVLASGFAGVTPGGTDGGGWPLFALLLVPFSLALVDSARRTVRVATWPAAVELRSRRDRPG